MILPVMKSHREAIEKACAEMSLVGRTLTPEFFTDENSDELLTMKLNITDPVDSWYVCQYVGNILREELLKKYKPDDTLFNLFKVKF
jgi:hypothetical protein